MTTNTTPSQKLLEKTKWNPLELEEKIAEKIEKFAGLLTREGAVEILSRENGLPVEQKKAEVKIQRLSEAEAGKEISFIARVEHVFAPKAFDKNGRKGKLCNVQLKDSEGTPASLVLWNHDCRLATQFERGQEIEVQNAQVKNKNPLELHAFVATQIINRGEAPREATKKIAELKEGVEADFFARALEVGEIKEFKRTNKWGKEEVGKLARLLVADDSGKINVVLWDENAEVVKYLRVGEAVKVESGLPKTNAGELEVQLGWRARIIAGANAHGLSEREKLWEAHFPLRKLAELKEGETASVRAILKEIGSGRFFRKCKKCNAGMNIHETICNCGSIEYRDALMLDATIADETGEVQVIFFGREAAHLLGAEIITIDPQIVIDLKKPHLLGKKLMLIVRANQGKVSGKLEATCKHVVEAPN